MEKTLNFLIGVVAGALVGAAAGLFLAPASGNELRDSVQDRADGFVAEIKSAVAEERRRLEAELEALKRGELQVQ